MQLVSAFCKDVKPYNNVFSIGQLRNRIHDNTEDCPHRALLKSPKGKAVCADCGKEMGEVTKTVLCFGGEEIDLT